MTSLPPNQSDPSDSILINGLLIPAEDIQLIAAESGISLDGGEIFIWKRNIIVTSDKRHVVRAFPAINAAQFDQWLQLCPHAVGIRPDGNVVLPRFAAGENDDPLEILALAFKAVHRELRIQILTSLGAAASLLIVAIPLAWIAITYMLQHPNGPTGSRTVVYSIVLAVCSLMLFIRGCKLFARRARILRVIKNAQSNGDLQPELLATLLAPNTPPPPAVNLVVATTTIIGLTLMCCPFIGLLFSSIALALTFRKPHWTRTLAIIGVIVGTLSTLYVIGILIFNHH